MKWLVLVSTLSAIVFGSPANDRIDLSSNTSSGISATYDLRIVNGQNAAPEQLPYQVSIQTNGRHVCGGSVIGRNYVLTAAHCFPNNPEPSAYKVVAGLTNLNDMNAITVNIAAFIMHNLFPGGPVIAPHDIALIRLATLLTWSTSIQPLSVPNPGFVTSGTATVSGWGAINSAGTTQPNNLQFADVPIIENIACNALLNSLLGSVPNPFDMESNICTGSEVGYQATCYGDSGGPLALNGHIVGVVSWGLSPCASLATAPSVYTRVANYLSWIQEQAPDLQE